MKVECPRCHKIWGVPQGTPDITCNCHRYCQHGDKPSDCSMSAVSFSGDLGIYQGLHIDAADEGDDVMHLRYYCSVHKVYSMRVPITIDVDWQKWQFRRVPQKLRYSKHAYP